MSETIPSPPEPEPTPPGPPDPEPTPLDAGRKLRAALRGLSGGRAAGLRGRPLYRTGKEVAFARPVFDLPDVLKPNLRMQAREVPMPLTEG